MRLGEIRLDCDDEECFTYSSHFTCDTQGFHFPKAPIRKKPGIRKEFGTCWAELFVRYSFMFQLSLKINPGLIGGTIKKKGSKFNAHHHFLGDNPMPDARERTKVQR